jgi:anti-anti-sigma factor
MDIHIRVDRSHQAITLALADELDMATADTLIEAIDAFAVRRFRSVTLDLADLHFCDCAGLNALLTVHHAITTAGGHIRLTPVHRRVQELLLHTGCHTLFDREIDQTTPAPDTATTLGDRAHQQKNHFAQGGECLGAPARSVGGPP